mgnify:CR=1 FL=1
MATYAELKTLESDGPLQNLVEIAIWVAAEKISDEDDQTPNHTNRLKWAKSALRDPAGAKDDFLRYLLAAERDQSLATIQAVTDSAVQTRVDAAVDIFADGGS